MWRKKNSSDKKPQLDKIKATPAAKRAADELGVAIAEIAGTGPDGRVQFEDVLAYSNSSLDKLERNSSKDSIKEVIEQISSSGEEKIDEIDDNELFDPLAYADMRFNNNGNMDNEIKSEESESTGEVSVAGKVDARIEDNGSLYSIDTSVNVKNIKSIFSMGSDFDKISYKHTIYKACCVALRNTIVNNEDIDIVSRFFYYIDGEARFTTVKNVDELPIRSFNLKLNGNSRDNGKADFTIYDLMEVFVDRFNPPYEEEALVLGLCDYNGSEDTIKIILRADVDALSLKLGVRYLKIIKEYLENPALMLL